MRPYCSTTTIMNDDATATTRGRTTLGSSVFLAEEDWDSDEDLSEYDSDDDDNYKIDISRVQLDQGYEREGINLTNYTTTEEIDLDHDENLDKDESSNKTPTDIDMRKEVHGWDGESTEGHEDTIYDSNVKLTGRKDDCHLANRWLQAVATRGEEEDDRMEYEIQQDQTDGPMETPEKDTEPSDTMQDGTDGRLLEEHNQSQSTAYEASNYERFRITQGYRKSQIGKRQIIEDEATEGSTMSTSTHSLLLTVGNVAGQVLRTDGNLLGQGGTEILMNNQSLTTELTQVIQSEDEEEAGDHNKQPSGTTASDIQETDIARTSPVLWSQVAAGRLPQGSAGSPNTYTLLGTLANDILAGEESAAVPARRSSLQRHIAIPSGTGLEGDTSTGGGSSNTATTQETQPAIKASSHRTQSQKPLTEAEKGSKGPQNE